MVLDALPAEVDVLVVGGGPTGLAAALALEQRNVRVIVVERRTTLSPLPKARALNARTMQVLRRLGVEDAIADRALSSRRLGIPLTFAETLASAAPSRDVAQGRRWSQHSPVPAVICPQNIVEQILRSRLGESVLRTGVTADDLAADTAGVSVCLSDAARDQQTVRAKYVIAADGANSVLRTRLGIGMREEHRSAKTLLVLFDADLSSLVEGRLSNMYFLSAGGVKATLQPAAEPSRWTFNRVYENRADTPSEPPSAAECATMIRTVLGRDTVAVHVLNRQMWQLRCGVAESFREGRTFLAGDAAHILSPFSGSGMNLGIQDADNLAWKLAACLHDYGGPDLLKTYEQERRPVAAWAVREDRTNLAEAVESGPGWQRWSEVVGRRLAKEGFELGVRYTSTAIFSDKAASEEPNTAVQYAIYRPTAAPGNHAPHVIFEQDGSVLDVFGTDPVLLTADRAWREVVALAVTATRIPLQQVLLPIRTGDADPGPAWCQHYGVTERGAVLVRPDGYVAWRWADPGPWLEADKAAAHLIRVLTICWSLPAGRPTDQPEQR